MPIDATLDTVTTANGHDCQRSRLPRSHLPRSHLAVRGPARPRSLGWQGCAGASTRAERSRWTAARSSAPRGRLPRRLDGGSPRRAREADGLVENPVRPMRLAPACRPTFGQPEQPAMLLTGAPSSGHHLVAADNAVAVGVETDQHTIIVVLLAVQIEDAAAVGDERIADTPTVEDLVGLETADRRGRAVMTTVRRCR